VYGELQQERDIQGGNLNKKVYVANLPSLVGGPELKALFSNAGNVMPVNIVEGRQTGQPRGFAFVEMSTQWEARRAVSMLNRTDFMGGNLLVEPHGQSPALGGIPNQRPCGATSRPKDGAFIHGRRPWLSAAGVKEATEKRGFRGR
jgi:cold-inducible RNA-binding protein